MQFSNLRQSARAVYILRNDQQQYSLWPAHCDLPAGWTVVPRSRPRPATRLAANWSTLTPPIMRHKELTMTTRLPLVAAQPGSGWPSASTLPRRAWPTMLNCAAPSTRRCWEKRLSPVCSRRTPSACAEEEEEVWRWRPTAPCRTVDH